jgi:hypothetical protein
MKSFYVALIEVEQKVEEVQGKRFVAAMNEFKASGEDIGNVTYYQVRDEHQYRKAEKEFKAQVQ